MCRARYKFSYRARTVGAARCLPPDCETSVHSGNDLVQPCIGARRSVPMADSDGVPGGAAGYASLSPRPLPPRSVHFRLEIGSPPARDRFGSGSRSVHFRLEIGSVPARDRFTSAPRSGRGVRRASLPLESGASARLWLLAPSTCTTFGGEQGAHACWRAFFSQRQRSGHPSLEPTTARPAPAPQQPTRHGSWRSDRRRARTG